MSNSPTATLEKLHGPHPTDIHAGRQLRALRILRGFTQTKLANQIGISFQQIQKYERGTNRMGASRLHELANVLTTDVGFFFEGLSQYGTKPLTESLPILSSRALKVARYIDIIPDDATKDAILHLSRALIEKADS